MKKLRVFHFRESENLISFAHITPGVPAEGVTTGWLNPVTDEDYNKL